MSPEEKSVEAASLASPGDSPLVRPRKTLEDALDWLEAVVWTPLSEVTKDSCIVQEYFEEVITDKDGHEYVKTKIKTANRTVAFRMFCQLQGWSTPGSSGTGAGTGNPKSPARKPGSNSASESEDLEAICKWVEEIQDAAEHEDEEDWVCVDEDEEDEDEDEDNATSESDFDDETETEIEGESKNSAEEQTEAQVGVEAESEAETNIVSETLSEAPQAIASASAATEPKAKVTEAEAQATQDTNLESESGSESESQEEPESKSDSEPPEELEFDEDGVCIDKEGRVWVTMDSARAIAHASIRERERCRRRQAQTCEVGRYTSGGYPSHFK